MSAVILTVAAAAATGASALLPRVRHLSARHAVAGLALAAFGLLGFGTNAKAATLWQIWQAAKVHDPAFQAAAATLAQARAARPDALSALLPHIDGSLSRNYYNASSEGPEYFGQNQILPVSQSTNTGTTNWQVQLSQPLFDWSAIKNLQAADLDAAAAAATYQDTLSQLAVKVTTDYMTVLLARATLDATQATVKGFAEQSRQADARYNAGMTGVIGADAARAGLESARGQLLAARQGLTAAQNALQAVTGGLLPDPGTKLPTHYEVRLSGDQGSWLARALKNNPRLAAARLSARADNHRIGAVESGYLPNVSLALTHNQQIQSGKSSYSIPGQTVPTPADYNATGNQIALQLTWNFYSGGATRARVAKAQAQADQSDANATSTRIDVTREIKTRYAALEIDAQRLKTLQAAVVAARDAVQATTRGVPAGVRTEDDLVTQRERLLSAQQALNDAVATTITDEISLARTSGTLTDRRLQALSHNLAQAPASGTQSPPTQIQTTGDSK
jgi:outer membrane protein